MARKKDDNAAGKHARRVIDGPDIEHDELIGKIGKWNSEDRQRASSAAETRGEIGKFTELTGINPKALSMLRTIEKEAAKDGGQAKAMDIIRSLEKGLPMVKADIGGQQSEMNLDEDDEPIDPEGSTARDQGDDFDDPNMPPAPPADEEFDQILAQSTVSGEAA